MKKIKILLLVFAAMSMMLILSACAEPTPQGNQAGSATNAEAGANGQNDVDDEYADNDADDENADNGANEEDTASDIIIPAGFVEYRSNAIGFSVHHSSDWITLDDSIDLNEVLDFLAEEADGELDALMDILDSADLSAVTVMWYDFDNMYNDVAPNTNIVVDSAMGATVDMLRSESDQAEIQEMFESMFSQVFDGFTVVENMRGKYLGNSFFVTFRFDASIMGVPMSFNQTMTIANGQMFTFTHTTPGGRMNVTENDFLQMLSTFSVD